MSILIFGEISRWMLQLFARLTMHLFQKNYNYQLLYPTMNYFDSLIHKIRNIKKIEMLSRILMLTLLLLVVVIFLASWCALLISNVVNTVPDDDIRVVGWVKWFILWKKYCNNKLIQAVWTGVFELQVVCLREVTHTTNLHQYWQSLPRFRYRLLSHRWDTSRIVPARGHTPLGRRRGPRPGKVKVHAVHERDYEAGGDFPT